MTENFQSPDKPHPKIDTSAGQTNKPKNPLVGGASTESGNIEQQGMPFVKREVSRWPALVALVLIGLIFIILSDRLTGGFGWLLLPVLAILIVPAIVSRRRGFHELNHTLLLIIVGVVTLSEIGSIGLLLISLPDKTISALSLLRDAALLWITNVIVFALWYWQLDAGGPYQRSHEACTDYRNNAELLFPQLTLIDERPRFKEWRPGFIDYLFVAFNTSTAFSPTDTPVLSTPIKIASMTQSALSLVTLATLAARAINIL